MWTTSDSQVCEELYLEGSTRLEGVGAQRTLQLEAEPQRGGEPGGAQRDLVLPHHVLVIVQEVMLERRLVGHQEPAQLALVARHALRQLREVGVVLVLEGFQVVTRRLGGRDGFGRKVDWQNVDVGGGAGLDQGQGGRGGGERHLQ